MSGITISPSILGYEQDLFGNLDKIGRLYDAGIRNLHIDVMRPPFIRNRIAFENETIADACAGWLENFGLDFHLMANEPDKLFETLAEAVPRAMRQRCLVTLHREAYRDYSPLEKQGLGKYAGKEYDLSAIIATGKKGSEAYQKVVDTQARTENMLTVALNTLHGMGFMTGIAAEPNTCNVAKPIIRAADVILVRCVHSDEGDQEFINEMLEKIAAVRKAFPNKSIQADGGINAENLCDVLDAGADNIVIGSYITDADDPAERVREVRDIISGHETRKLLDPTRKHPNA